MIYSILARIIIAFVCEDDLCSKSKIFWLIEGMGISIIQQHIETMSRFFIILGSLLIILGLLLPYLDKLGLGKLPGGIYIERENFSFYFPLTTSIVLSVCISLVLWLLKR